MSACYIFHHCPAPETLGPDDEGFLKLFKKIPRLGFAHGGVDVCVQASLLWASELELRHAGKCCNPNQIT